MRSIQMGAACAGIVLSALAVSILTAAGAPAAAPRAQSATNSARPASAEAAAKPGPAAAAAGPPVEIVDAEGVMRAVAAARGRVAVLNFWATWCDPCREEFPDLVRFASENASTVALITVSLDDASDADARVRPFLKEMRFAGRALIKGTGDPDLFITRIDSKWSGSLPATFIHAPDGRRAQSVLGSVSYEQLKAMAVPLLSPSR